MWKRDLGPLITTLDPEQEREQRLMAQARSGAIWALDALVARYQSTLIRYLSRLVGDKERAEALAEETLVRMERRLYIPRPIIDLRLWLLRAATDAGLDTLRRPSKQPPRLAAASGPALLPEGRVATPTQKLRTTLGRLTQPRGARERQSRPRPSVAETAEDEQAEQEPVDPREAFRRRLVRAVLAELPMEDARCVALHLVAGLNQAEVARTLAMPPSRARARIVEGLAIFGRQYKAALDTLGIPRELGYGVGFGAEASLEAPPEALPRYRSPFTRLPETPAESGMVVDESGEVVEPGLSEEELRLNAISNQPTVSLVVDAEAPWADELERVVAGEPTQVIPVLSPPADSSAGSAE
ncbi:MAG TPA: RNA polymerase sigma factor [Ktedonobacterales bacterium]|nr:RNA polymerase sigma factor [Ktedonobacterales bacterium]